MNYFVFAPFILSTLTIANDPINSDDLVKNAPPKKIGLLVQNPEDLTEYNRHYIEHHTDFTQKEGFKNYLNKFGAPHYHQPTDPLHILIEAQLKKGIKHPQIIMNCFSILESLGKSEEIKRCIAAIFMSPNSEEHKKKVIDFGVEVLKNNDKTQELEDIAATYATFKNPSLNVECIIKYLLQIDALSQQRFKLFFTTKKFSSFAANQELADEAFKFIARKYVHSLDKAISNQKLTVKYTKLPSNKLLNFLFKNAKNIP